MANESLIIGLKIYKGKTKDIDPTGNIQIVKTEIEKGTDYKYLGQTIAMENGTRQAFWIGMKQGGAFLDSTGISFWTGTFL